MAATPPIDLMVAEHAAFVRALARRLLRDRDAAEDVSQETWRAVLERGPRAVGDVRAWLAGLVRNLVGLHRRRAALRQRREGELAGRLAAQPACATGAQARLDELGRLVAALRRLREPFLGTVLLRYQQGLPPRAIARRTGVPVDTVKSRLKRALQQLRREMGAAHGGDEHSLRRGLVLLAGGARWTALPAAAAAALLFGSGLLVWQWPSPATVAAPAATAAAAAAGEQAAAAPGLVRVPVVVGAPVLARTLRVVDAATGEAVPGFVVAAAGHEPEIAASDAAGALHLRLATGQELQLRLLDDLRLRSDRPIRGELVGDELRVAVGPTFCFALQPAPGVDERFDVRLVAAAERQQERTCFSPLRAGPLPWVRFAAEALAIGPGPWRLELRSDDGYRCGAAEVEAAGGVGATPVAVTLRDTGRVCGRVLDQAGGGVDQAAVALAAGGREFTTVSDAAGAFDLAWIPPGSYTLRAQSRRFAAASIEVVVAARADCEPQLRLGALPERADVRGVLRSAAGARAPALPGPLAVVLVSRADPERTFVQTLAFDPARGPLPFTFAGVPQDQYELAVRAPDFCRWQPAVLPVQPGEPAVELVRCDGERLQDLELRAVDAESAEELPRFDAFVRLDGDERTAKVLAAAGRLRLCNVPLDAAVEWIARADGHAPVRGGRDDLLAPAALPRGWGNLLRCVDRHGRPLAGVAVKLDGRPAGATGADGALQLAAEKPPTTLALAPGWRLVAGDLSEGGSYRDLIWGLAATVEPAPEEGR